MTTITTIAEAIETITTVLGEFANDFDIEGIAHELTEWKDGKILFDDDRIFEVAPKYDMTTSETNYAIES